MGLTDSAGNLAAVYEYDPFGNVIAQEGTAAALAANPFRFSTKYFDEGTGLYYYGYRYYHPQIQRWMSRDPLGEAGGVNQYAFVGNDPVIGVDPLGLAPGTPISTKGEWFGGALGVGTSDYSRIKMFAVRRADGTIHIRIERGIVQQRSGSWASFWDSIYGTEPFFESQSIQTGTLPAGVTRDQVIRLFHRVSADNEQFGAALAEASAEAGAWESSLRSIPLGNAAADINNGTVNWRTGVATAGDALFLFGGPAGNVGRTGTAGILLPAVPPAFGVATKGAPFVTMANYGRAGKWAITAGTTTVGTVAVIDGGSAVYEGGYLRGSVEALIGVGNVAYGYRMYRYGAVGKVRAPDAPWGTGPFGTQIERSIHAWLKARYPGVRFRFTSAPRTGIDVEVAEFFRKSPGFSFAEIKPNTYSGYRKMARQMINWGVDDIRPITFDHNGNIYFDFKAPVGVVNPLHTLTLPLDVPSPGALPTLPSTRPSGG